ncbi:hypothetical protein, partial [Streptomyces thermoviolaceus]|uniref:hypothetical protein n=1 Tax=Streptomyces thermoviolaceus TaxID=1952 RepID=UPI001E472A0A
MRTLILDKKHPDASEWKAGRTGSKVLIKSEPPERETREREPGKRKPPGTSDRKDLIESETPKGKRPEESP